MENEEIINVVTDNVQVIPPQTGVMSNANWEQFSKGDLMNFLIKYNLQKITIDDGAGKKATVRINAKGEYNVTYTSTEVM